MVRGLVLAAAVVGLSGCGPAEPQLAAVEGRVTVSGRPLANVEVVFAPAGGAAGREVAAYTDAEGRYRIPHDPANEVGVPVGVHRVLVRDAEMYLVAPADGIVPESGEATGGRRARPERKRSRVPLAYGDAARTPLQELRVQPGNQTFDIVIPAK